jgi:hypothetical protein
VFYARFYFGIDGLVRTNGNEIDIATDDFACIYRGDRAHKCGDVNEYAACILNVSPT